MPLTPNCYVFFLSLLFLVACARQGAPAGGPKDTQPPGIDTLASTPNYATRFAERRIKLEFDEWVVLSDASTQIVVSPPLAKRPEVVLKGRTVTLTFDKSEVLRPATTYTINFGSAVKDLHENNPARDLRFVFSTGDFIDSLITRGIVTDALTGEPVENIAVMLYDNFADSTIRKDRPYYFTRTEKTGQYEFRNLRAGRFRLVAIDDADQNLKWNGDNERIAFRETALVLSDSLRVNDQLKLFKNRSIFRLASQNANRYGLVKVNFSTATDSFDLQFLAPPGLRTLAERAQDSLLLWYDLPADTAWSLRLLVPEMTLRDTQSVPRPPDTILVKKISRSDFIANHRLGFGDEALPPQRTGKTKQLGVQTPAAATPAAKTVVQTHTKPATIPFNLPITSFDTARWLLSVDTNSIRAFSVSADSASPRRLLLSLAWLQGKTHTLTLLPGAVTDFWGAANVDTLRRIFLASAEKQLGTLALTVEKIKPGTQYILQVFNDKVLEEERVFRASSTEQKFVFPNLQVAAYTVRLVEDRNANGRWDTGDFAARRQPEPVFSKKLETLRANWEVEATISTDAATGREKKLKK